MAICFQRAMLLLWIIVVSVSGGNKWGGRVLLAISRSVCCLIREQSPRE